MIRLKAQVVEVVSLSIPTTGTFADQIIFGSGLLLLKNHQRAYLSAYFLPKPQCSQRADFTSESAAIG